MESGREAAEELGHREIGFPIAEVHRGVEDHRLAGRESRGIAGPEIAVQQRRHGRMTGEQQRNRRQQLLADALQPAAAATRPGPRARIAPESQPGAAASQYAYGIVPTNGTGVAAATFWRLDLVSGMITQLATPGFDANRNVMMGVEGALGLYAKGAYVPDGSILPEPYSSQQRKWNWHFVTLTVLILTVLGMVVALIVASPCADKARADESGAGIVTKGGHNG
jgi:hypothetical protein